MQAHTVDTPGGRFKFCGDLSGDRPGLLAICGAFPRDDTFQDLIARHPDADVLVAYPPGSQTPWSGAGVALLTESLEAAVGPMFGRRPLVVFGASTGSLLALGFRGPNVVRKVILEPFLRTRDLWPFIAFAQGLLARNPDDAGVRAYLWSIFGVSDSELQDRDYRRLLQAIGVPTDVIVGSVPLLPERKLSGWPSFTSAEDRAALAATPQVTLHDAGPFTGHGLYDHPVGGAVVQEVIRAAVAAAGAGVAR